MFVTILISDVLVGIVSFLLIIIFSVVFFRHGDGEPRRLGNGQIAALFFFLIFFAAANYFYLPRFKEYVDRNYGYRDRGCVFLVEGRSMEPTLLPGQNEATDCCQNKGCFPIERGDLIVFYSKEEKKDHIKRVVGLPGETVTVDMGSVYIDNHLLLEPYTRAENSTYYPSIPTKCRTILLDNNYYVLGDNRNNSYDSRYEGPIELSQISAIAKYGDRPPPNGMNIRISEETSDFTNKNCIEVR